MVDTSLAYEVTVPVYHLSNTDVNKVVPLEWKATTILKYFVESLLLL
jgi:hypothetical protein